MAQPCTSASFVYDGNGVRVAKTEDRETVHYPNRFYEKNTTAGTITTYYYLGSRLVALRKGSTLEHLHQDHLDRPAVTTDSNARIICHHERFHTTED